MTRKTILSLFICLSIFGIKAQNLVVDGNISSSNANWGGGSSEAPYNTTTYESVYLTGGCSNNYIMEVDNGSQPQQTVNGFVSGAQYVLTFRYAWRNSGCSASVNPTNLVIQFTDALAVLNLTISVPNTLTTLTAYSYTFTNNASTSHILRLTNPGNTNTCGVILDDISIVRVVSPGGVGGANLSAWFRAGTIGGGDGLGVFGWISSGNNSIVLTPPCANPPTYKTGLASAANSLVANFNPYIVFNGTNQYLANTIARYDLMNLSGGGGGSAFAVHQGGSASRTYFGQKASSASWGSVWMNTSEFQMANAGGNGRDATYTTSSRNNIIAFNGNSSTMNLKDKNGAGLTDNNGSLDVDYLTVGARRVAGGSFDQYYNGSLSEIIEFNTTLSNLQMQQVRSYLATKYGVTLADNTATGAIDERTYLASNGTTDYWTYSANSAYHNNVTVIGYDANTSLDQRKSISTDADVNALTAMSSNSMLTIDNGAAFTADMSYLAAGHNGLAVDGNNTVDIPAGIQSRMQRFWKFQKTGSGVANSVTLTFNMTGFTPLTGSDLRLLVSTTNSFGTATTTIISGSYVAPNFTVLLPTTGGVYFTVGSINLAQTPLPIELTDFTASPNGNKVDLTWVTASERNNDYFTIEKTKDGQSFEFVAEVNGAGNSTSMLHYASVDTKPYKGLSYYRLKQTDFNGAYSFSNLVAVEFLGSTAFDFNVYPNPSTGENINIAIQSDSNEEVLVVVRDINGKETYSKILITEQDGETVYAFDIEKKLAAGIYFITATSKNEVLSKKLIVK